MIANKSLQKLEKSSMKLTLTVGKADVKKAYDTLISRYSKSVQIPGFRKGHVPASVLESKFGEGLKTEALHDIMDKSLQEVLESLDPKPLNFAPPRLAEEDLKLDFDADLTFSLIYDVFPEVKLGNYKGVEIEEPQVEVSKKDEERELKQIQEQNAVVMDKASGKVADGDVVTLDFVEVDEAGEEIASTRRQDFTFTVGTEYNIYKFDKEVTGLAKDAEKVISKSYPADYEHKELAGTKKSIKVKIKAVKEKKLPALDDDLAQDVNDQFKTLDDLKKSIRDRLGNTIKDIVKQKNLDALLEKVVAGSTFDLPESMIQAEMEHMWDNLAQQNRMTAEQMNNIFGPETKAKMMEAWRSGAEKSLRQHIVKDAITEQEKIEISDAEVDAELTQIAEKRKTTLEEIKKTYESAGLIPYIKGDLKEKKVTEFLLTSAKVKKGKKMEYKELVDLQE